MASIGGAPSADIVWDELRRAVVLIAQEHHVFAASLRDNLVLARDADDAALWEVLHRVGAGWAEELPAGLDTRLGDRQLSLGQAQQLALARVALADPEIVILDEATSGLDAAAETDLTARTLITITHQLPAAAAADRVAVVDGGRVVELGDHASLASAGGAYARLWAAWASGRDRAIGHG